MCYFSVLCNFCFESSVFCFLIGIIYLTLGNIPPKFRSTLNAIQLLCVATFPVIKEYGIDTLLEPIMNDLACLEQVYCMFLELMSYTNFKENATVLIYDTVTLHK